MFFKEDFLVNPSCLLSSSSFFVYLLLSLERCLMALTISSSRGLFCLIFWVFVDLCCIEWFWMVLLVEPNFDLQKGGKKIGFLWNLHCEKACDKVD